VILNVSHGDKPQGNSSALISLNSSNKGYNLVGISTGGDTSSFITMKNLCLVSLNYVKNSPRLQIDKKDRPSSSEASAFSPMGIIAIFLPLQEHVNIWLIHRHHVAMIFPIKYGMHPCPQHHK